MQTTNDSLKRTIDPVEVEDSIHREFWSAFAAWEEAPEDDKPKASLRVNATVRQLYDFVVRGKVPQEQTSAFRAS